MPYTTVEEALGRVLAYLRGAGLAMTPEATREALRLIERALDEDRPEQLLESVMRHLPAHFDPPPVDVPAIAPPVHHGSVHYADYL